jgi:hypothetical protein
MRRALVSALLLSSAIQAFSQPTFVDGPGYVAALHAKKIVHIEVIATLHNNSVETSSGTGVSVSDSYVITAGHVIGNRSKYKSIVVLLRTDPSSTTPVRAKVEEVDETIDVALLEREVPIHGIGGCPMFLVNNPAAVPMGSDLFFLGFPLDGPLRLSPGLMSVDPSVGPLWQTNAPINPGDSGAPAYTKQGYLAGIAKKSTLSAKLGEDTVRVSQVSYFVPGPKIKDSSIGLKILSVITDRSCLKSVAMNSDGSFGLFQAQTGQDAEPVRMLQVSQWVSKSWQANSTETTERQFSAIPGYRMVSCKLEVVAQKDATGICSVASNKSSAVAIFVAAASSGRVPSYSGRVVLTQELAGK